ncbi:MAG: ATP synthase subunit I [Burkholderia sp.]
MAGQAPEDRHDDHRRAQQVAGVQRHDVPHAEVTWEAGQQDNNIVPLTRAESEALFGPYVSRPSRVTPFRVVIAQVVLSLVATLAWWLFSKSPGAAAQSAMLGGAIGWVPNAAFAAKLRFGGANPMMGWMFGEALKLGVTIAMFTAVALRFPGVLWVPLLVTYLVALKTCWLALA